MRVAILDAQGVVLNIIMADAAFCDQHYPGKWVRVDDAWCEIGTVWKKPA